MRAAITGIGHYVPEKVLNNQDLERMVETNDEWIVSRTGIRERRILEKDQGTSVMAIPAARQALESAGVTADEVELILMATVTPDRQVPTTASVVQHALGAENCWGYDINGGCAGFLCALTTGTQFIESGRHKTVLVIGADKMSCIVDYQDRNTCVLFGDAAGAVVLQAEEREDRGIQDFKMCLDGSGGPHLVMEGGGSLHPASHDSVDQKMHYIYQDGRTVFKRAVKDMADVSVEIMERNQLGGSDICLLIPHQANFRIIDAVGRRMNLHPDQVVVNIEKYGNTTAATIPLALYEAYHEGKMRPGDRIVFAAFGAGFTWGSLLMHWSLSPPDPAGHSNNND